MKLVRSGTYNLFRDSVASVFVGKIRKKSLPRMSVVNLTEVFCDGGWYHLLMKKVVIYSKPDCHLCEEAKAAILAAGSGDRFTLEEVNIESDPELHRRYRYDIPVITIDDVEAFRHRVNSEEFRRAIEAGVSR